MLFNLGLNSISSLTSAQLKHQQRSVYQEGYWMSWLTGTDLPTGIPLNEREQNMMHINCTHYAYSTLLPGTSQ
jgi:hypothetical protein